MLVLSLGTSRPNDDDTIHVTVPAGTYTEDVKITMQLLRQNPRWSRLGFEAAEFVRINRGKVEAQRG